MENFLIMESGYKWINPKNKERGLNGQVAI
jgi:hypothetical protein